MPDNRLLHNLLNGAKLLGGVYQMDFATALVITDDTKKEACGGVALRSFAIATLANEDDIEQGNYTGPGLDEAVLLSVAGIAPMPNEPDLVRTRLVAIENAVNGDEPPDTTTKAHIEQSALRCDVMGTFYQDVDENGRQFLNWGSDLDIVYSGARYFVYAPSVEGLSYLGSYTVNTEIERASGAAPDLLALGVVRPASTRKRSRAYGADKAQVCVRVDDFIGRRTAVLGMTRSGKSNTNKILATAVFKHSRSTGRPIGQLIFDPQGEYANINVQDGGTALKDIGSEWVRIYLMSPDTEDPQQRSLAFNFYDRDNIAAAHEIVCEVFASSSSGDSAYGKPFLQADLSRPDRETASVQEHEEWEKGALAFYALLAAAGFELPGNFKHSFVIAEKLAAAILEDNPDAFRLSTSGRTRAQVTTADGLFHTMSWICTAVDDLRSSKDPDPKHVAVRRELETWGRDDKLFDQVRGMYYSNGARRAASKQISTAKPFHNPDANDKAEEKILLDLQVGMIVIVDLSIGAEKVVQSIAERIVRYVLADANDRFRSHRPLVPMQVLVEEAHRLLDKDAVNARNFNPWVRLAKEGAKYQIGFQFATQEVSSIDKRILSQTHNWVIAHLNSDNETRELGHYYKFAAWEDQVRGADDVGYIRLQTYSGKFIVPVQVRKFDLSEVNEARSAAGLPPVGAPMPTQPRPDWQDDF